MTQRVYLGSAASEAIGFDYAQQLCEAGIPAISSSPGVAAPPLGPEIWCLDATSLLDDAKLAFVREVMGPDTTDEILLKARRTAEG